MQEYDWNAPPLKFLIQRDVGIREARFGSFDDQAVALALLEYCREHPPFHLDTVAGCGDAKLVPTAVENGIYPSYYARENVLSDVCAEKTDVSESAVCPGGGDPVGRGDVSSASLHLIDHAIVLQKGNGLPDRLSADAETLDKLILSRQPAGRRIQPAQNLPFQYLRYLRILRHFPILAQNVHTTLLKFSTDGRFVKIFMLSVFSLQ